MRRLPLLALLLLALLLVAPLLVARPFTVSAYTNVTCVLNDTVVASLTSTFTLDSKSQWIVWVNAPLSVLTTWPAAALVSSSAAPLSSSAVSPSSSAAPPSSSAAAPVNASSSAAAAVASSSAAAPVNASSSAAATALASSSSAAALASSSASALSSSAATTSSSVAPAAASSNVAAAAASPSAEVSNTHRRRLLTDARARPTVITDGEPIAASIVATDESSTTTTSSVPQLTFAWLPAAPNTSSSTWSSLLALARSSTPAFVVNYTASQTFNLTIVSPLPTATFTGFLLYAMTESYLSVGTLSGTSALTSGTASLPAACQTDGSALTDAGTLVARSTLTLRFTVPATNQTIYVLGALVNALTNTVSLLPAITFTSALGNTAAGPQDTPNITLVTMQDGAVTLSCAYTGDSGSGPITSFEVHVYESPLSRLTEITPVATAVYASEPRSFTANVSIASGILDPQRKKQIYMFKVIAKSAYGNSTDSKPVTFPIIHDEPVWFVPTDSCSPTISALGVLGIVLGSLSAIGVVWLIVRFYRRKGQFDLDVKGVVRTIAASSRQRSQRRRRRNVHEQEQHEQEQHEQEQHEREQHEREQHEREQHEHEHEHEHDIVAEQIVPPKH